MFTQSDETIVWQQVRQSRTECIAYLATLSDEQWNQMSLCDGWRCRDVLAHLILEFHYKASESWLDIVRSGFSVNRFMKKTASKLGDKPTTELINQFQLVIDEQYKPASISVINVLVDLIVHEQDIRIPLNQPKVINLDLLQLIFFHWQPGEYNFGEKITGLAARLKGLKLTITDLGISKGTGAEVVGNAQDILLAMVGRRTPTNRLSGEGARLLLNRLK